MDSDRKESSYFSTSGYRMYGGHQHVPSQASPYTWISVGLVVGLAVVVATYLALK